MQRILSELAEGGYLLREREGRRNRYEVVTTVLQHPLPRDRSVDEPLKVLGT